MLVCQVRQSAGNGAVRIGTGVLVDQRSAHVVVPMRVIRSRVDVPACAAQVLPACRRSWKCSHPQRRTPDGP